MWQTYLKICFLAIVFFHFQSCGSRDHKVDISNIEVNTSIIRFEHELVKLSKAENLETAFQEMVREHPIMSEVYFSQVLPIGGVENPQYARFQSFLNDTNITALLSDIDKIYPTLDNEAKELSEAFRYYKYYYPQDTLPQVYSTASMFSYVAFTYDKLLVVALDNFLGSAYEGYPTSSFPAYMKRRMSSEYLVPRAMKTLFGQKYPAENQTDETLLSQMIWSGKQLLWLDIMLPDYHDSLKIEYTLKQLEGIVQDEDMVFNHFVENELFYSTDTKLINRYLGEAPFTSAPGLPSGFPPRMAEWMGWIIVKKYLEENRDVSPVQLFEETDYKKIFKGAKYRPF